MATAAAAETKAEDLAKVPADAIHYSIVSSAGKHGDSTRWFTPDGQEMGRESMVLRGQVFETDSVTKFLQKWGQVLQYDTNISRTVLSS